MSFEPSGGLNPREMLGVVAAYGHAGVHLSPVALAVEGQDGRLVLAAEVGVPLSVSAAFPVDVKAGLPLAMAGSGVIAIYG